MFAIPILLATILVSLLVVRVATEALVLTGLSRDLARFEARSAFTGTGFTTPDSAVVINNPVRRRVIMTLMLLGNAGIVTVMSALVVGFDKVTGIGFVERLVGLFVGIFLLWAVAHSKWVDRQLSKYITKALKRFTRMDINDYVGLLRLGNDFTVAQMFVNEDNWMANKSLMELRLSDEGVLVLGIERSQGAYQGAPKGQTILYAGDNLLVYGPHGILEELDKRRATPEGEQKHKEAVDKQQAHVTEASEVASQE